MHIKATVRNPASVSLVWIIGHIWNTLAWFWAIYILKEIIHCLTSLMCLLLFFAQNLKDRNVIAEYCHILKSGMMKLTLQFHFVFPLVDYVMTLCQESFYNFKGKNRAAWYKTFALTYWRFLQFFSGYNSGTTSRWAENRLLYFFLSFFHSFIHPNLLVTFLLVWQADAESKAEGGRKPGRQADLSKIGKQALGLKTSRG